MLPWIGYFAAFLTTAAFLPQTLLVLRTRQTAGISLWTYVIFTLGVGMWLYYGVMTGSGPIIAANVVTFVLSLTILVMKIRLG